jgi:tRNA dimethylallyltransferase
LINVPLNQELRENLAPMSDLELEAILHELKALHNTTDTSDRDRLLRALEIQTYYQNHPELDLSFPKIETKIFGIDFDRRVVIHRITERLDFRLKNGMLDEVHGLLNKGVTKEQLKFYGLEYRFVTQYIAGEIGYNEMFRRLETAIHQFSKRQMTWFRRMEKQGFVIHWLDGNLGNEEKFNQLLLHLK